VLAVRCIAHGRPQDVVVAELPEPEPGPGEVVLAVRAAAVNFPDTLMISDGYQVSVPAPFTCGSEFAGVVVAVGAGVDDGWLARHVMGGVIVGAFAERVKVPVTALTRVPDGLNLVQAAAFGVTYTTAYHSLATIGRASAGEWAVVLGAAGGVGTACVDLGVAMGLQVIAAASSAERVARCLDRGAVAGIDYSREDLKQRIKDLTGGGADVVVDPAGGPNAEAALRAMRWGGRFVTVGYASGTIPRIPLNLVLLKGVIIRGFELRTIAAHLPEAAAQAPDALARWVASGMRPMVSATYPLADAAQALVDVAERRVIGKAVIVMPGVE
jgi:NADPH2:quinone reductase